MTIKVLRLKRNGEPIVIELDVKHSVTAVYLKVTEKSLTMSAPTVLADSRTYQLVWYLATQIVFGNPSVHR